MKLISGLDRSQLSETEAFSYSTSSKHSLALEWLLVPLQSRKDLPTISPAPFQIKGNLFGKKGPEQSRTILSPSSGTPAVPPCPDHLCLAGRVTPRWRIQPLAPKYGARAY
jgi:hypothetical protein